MARDDLESVNIEIKLLLEAIHLKYGYDFRDYSWASIKRRIRHSFNMSGLESISAMQHAVLNDKALFAKLLTDLTINITEMFRDPSFYRAIREQVLPHLNDYPKCNIWHAGCATGEEVYSMAILLKEHGLYEKTQIYATDVNELVLAEAREGIYPIQRMKQFTANYQKSGGIESFSNYYTASYHSAIIDSSLMKNVMFASHNLVTDGVFGEMHMIVCRNVLIYFNSTLRNRVLRLFHESLVDGGFLCLGSKESMLFTEFANDFREVTPMEKIYQKIDKPL